MKQRNASAPSSIATVERETGFSKDTLRVWERRYGFPRPARDSNDERVYPGDQVERLRVIRRLMDAGFRPGKIVDETLVQLQARLRAAVRILRLQDQLVAAREASREQAMRDALTGLLNRGAVLDALQQECSRTDRIGGSFGVVMVDVDHFKTINDTHGHLVGDGVLREVAARLRACLRTYDSIGRFGGEEFLVIAPGCGTSTAEELAERLRRCVCDTPIMYSGRTLAVTISLGVAAGAGSAARDALLRGADEALYAAKAGGRNRFVRAA